ncbi:MAG: NOP58 family protein [Methanosarcinaceae archaeon]|nr:NOP58 family protein [Methanosarcinaceae archaeon]
MEFTTWFGRLTLDEGGKLIDCQPFEKDPEKLAGRILEIQEEEQDIPATASDLRQLAFDCGFVELDEDYDILLRDVSIRAAKSRISGSDTDDARIVQAVEALDDIDKNANELSERLREWYGIYFPELELTGESLARFVQAFGSRANVPEDNPLFEKASGSMGAELSFADEELLRAFASDLCSLYDTRRQIESYIVTGMGSLAPNLTDIAGGLLGARLISIAGSLQKLAAFPSSTVQVIGASRALFKHLRSNTPSPKHGIIFNNTIIKNAPWWQRGKLARAFASKISLAARTDLYSGKKNPSIREGLERKLTAIRNANSSPPKKKAKPKGRSSGSGGKGTKKRGGKS